VEGKTIRSKQNPPRKQETRKRTRGEGRLSAKGKLCEGFKRDALIGKKKKAPVKRHKGASLG